MNRFLVIPLIWGLFLIIIFKAEPLRVTGSTEMNIEMIIPGDSYDQYGCVKF